MPATFKEFLYFYKKLELFLSSIVPLKIFSVNLYSTGVRDKNAFIIFSLAAWSNKYHCLYFLEYRYKYVHLDKYSRIIRRVTTCK